MAHEARGGDGACVEESGVRSTTRVQVGGDVGKEEREREEIEFGVRVR